MNEQITKNNQHDGQAFWNGIEWEKGRRYREHEEEELKRCGVKTYQRKRHTPEWDKVIVIPVGEIEVSDELDSFVKNEILDGWDLKYPEWVRRCYIQRMAQILNDPAEFGKVVLQGKIRDHCIQKSDLEDCIDD
jgi:hypothetical protein